MYNYGVILDNTVFLAPFQLWRFNDETMTMENQRQRWLLEGHGLSIPTWKVEGEYLTKKKF